MGQVSLDQVKLKCSNGTLFTDLDIQGFNDCELKSNAQWFQTICHHFNDFFLHPAWEGFDYIWLYVFKYWNFEIIYMLFNQLEI